MKYDDYKWHLNENFPKDLDENKALTHIGMFMGWVIDSRLESELLNEHFSTELQEFKQRKITGSQFVVLCCDYKLTSDDLNEEANLFAEDYYAKGKYFDDYAKASDDNNDTIFHEADTWDNYIKIKNIIDKRYKKWKNKQ
jgi:hypothetical protein